jgi:hypothetical protein
MEDQELLAAIGKVVVDAAALEYAVAVLVAVTEGHRDQDCEDQAAAMVKKNGGAMRELRMRAAAQLRGRGLALRQIARMLPMPQNPEDDPAKSAREDLALWDRSRRGAIPQARCDLSFLWRDAKAVLDDRHIIAHSIPMEDADVDGQRGLTIWNPRHGAETQITTSQLLSFAQDIRIVYRRFHDAIAAETADH